MAIVFPASPSVNDTFTEGSITYKWDGAKWIGLGITPIDRLIEGSNKLEITAGNDLVWTGDRVGIGTNSPSNFLHVKNDTTASNYITAENTTAGNAGVRLKNSQGDYAIFANDDLIFYDLENDAEKLRITSGGMAEIFGSGPGGVLQLSSKDQTISAAGEVFGSITFKANDASTGQTGVFAKIDAASNRLFDGDNASGMDLRFYAGDKGDGVDTPPERLRIKSTGTVTVNNPTYNSNALVQTDAKDNTTYAPPTAYPANQIELQNSVSMGSAIMRFRSQSDNASAGIWNIGAVPRTASLVSDFVFQSRTADSTYTEIARFSGDGGLKLGAGRGIDFSANANATGATSETLDDYEEGNYSPAWLNATNVNYTSQGGQYVRVGSMVYVWGEFRFTTYTSFPNGWDQITLPFAGTRIGSQGNSLSNNWWAVTSGGTNQVTGHLNFGPLGHPGEGTNGAFTNTFLTGNNGMGNASIGSIFTSSADIKTIRFHICYTAQ